MINIQPTTQTSFNDLIRYDQNALRHLFTILKDPNLSRVCKFWRHVNSSWETYQLIWKIYRQQEFMAGLFRPFSVQYGNEYMYIEEVKRIFASVCSQVKGACIGGFVEYVRKEEHLGPLELNGIMKMVIRPVVC